MEYEQEELVELINDFVRETEESLENLEENIAVVEQYIYTVQKAFSIENYIRYVQGLNIEIFLENLRGINRVVHTIKGVSAFVNLTKINSYCHNVEELTIDISNGKVVLTNDAFEILSKLPIIINRFLEVVSEQYTDESIDIAKELEEINICRERLAEVMGGVVIHFDEIQGKDLGRIRGNRSNLKVTIDLRIYDEIVNDFQAVIQDSQNRLVQSGANRDLTFELRKLMTYHLDRLITSSQSNMVTTRYPRIVKDLGMSLNKDIKFVLDTNDAKARPDVWDKCHNALVHLVRNAVDHGIEMPADREKAGKSPQGHIILKISEDFKNIYISLKDDGKGIDPEKIASIAVEKNVMSEEAVSKLSVLEKQKLIFHPGFSTKQKATDISGRGVGMDAVAKEIENNLNGEIVLNSVPGEGTHMIMEIPKMETLSECILFGNMNSTYAIPMVNDISFLECKDEYISHVLGKTPVYTEKNLTLPVIDIFDYLYNENGLAAESRIKSIIVVGSSNGRYGIIVPEIKGQERLNIDRSSKLKTMVKDEGIVFGYGMTDPVTVVLDLDYVTNLINF